MGQNKRIIFIGALKNRTLDGSTGGVFTASSTLRRGLKEHGVGIIGLNTTYKMRSMSEGVRPVNKFFALIKRNFQFLFRITISHKAKSVLVFISAGNSYLDKLPAIILSKLLSKQIVLFPRSGFLLRDYEKPMYRKIINFSFAQADILICQSAFWKDYFISKGVPSEKLLIIENWYSSEKILLSERLPLKRLLLSDKINIIYLSRIEKAKGIDDLIFASEILTERGIEHTISVYGQGEYVSELKALIDDRNMKHIDFKGWLTDNEKLTVINRYDLGVFTSRFEGYPNSLLDFIFGKIPVIATNIDTVRAVGGNKMLYYPVNNPAKLADAILEVKNNYLEHCKNAEYLYQEKVINNNVNTASRILLKAIEGS